MAGAKPDFAALDCLGNGVLLCDPESFTIRFANATARQWFGGALDGRTLGQVFDGLDEGRLRERMAKGRSFSFDGEAKPEGGRALPWRLTMRPEPPGPGGLLVAEVHNMAQLRKQEYLLESYSNIIERKNREIEKAQERAERLLMNVFPLKVLQEFKQFGTTTPSFYDEVSVMFLDFVGFTRMPVSREPRQLIAELNDLFSTFDQIVEYHSCERIKTIGDAYLAVAGMPSPNPDHAFDITNVAVKILRYLHRRNETHPITWTCRIGIHTGSVVGSVVGVKKYIYDVFGEGVNTASRMQSLSEPMRITISSATHDIIRHHFACRPRGEVAVGSAEKMAVFEVETGESEDEETSKK